MHGSEHWTLVPVIYAVVSVLLLAPTRLTGQEPVSWDDPLQFSTFSIAAIDPTTGEVGVAVTSRSKCVGNAVPHVRVGVGAVATQAHTRIRYGPELLNRLAHGVRPRVALRQALAADSLAEDRQVGVISVEGRSAQHTGTATNSWAGERAGRYYITQGNTLVGPDVLAAVAMTFESTQGSGRYLGDRLIEALAAGQAAGGDRRKGRLQSAAVLVADPRSGYSRRPDHITVDINVCVHPTPVARLRRIYNTLSQTLGYRILQQFMGPDVLQLKIILHALGYFEPEEQQIGQARTALIYTQELVDAVYAFRKRQGLSTLAVGSPPGLVTDRTISRLWAALEQAGKAQAIHERLRELTMIRR